ncbi:MAG: GLPGLI family protein [Chitinophagaceae bacterium]
MKKFIVLMLMVSLTRAVGQDHINNQLVHYTIKYNHLFDRGKDVKDYDAKLYIQGDRSLFTMKQGDKIEMSYQSNYYDASPDSLFTVYKDFESNSLLFDFYHLQQGNIFYADTLHPMEWKLESEEKNVSGIPCRRATVRFKGRDYVAWYAPSIPISNGPWKLGGLPGLILEAYDQQGEWHAIYNKIEELNFIDLGYFEKLVNKGVGSFSVFVSDLKDLLKRMTGSLSGQGSSDCFTCETKSLVKLYMWEKID